MTPSLPTLSMASAMMLPISLSLLAEMVATCSISFAAVTRLEQLREMLDDRFHGLVDAALEGHRVGAGGDVAEALWKMASASTVAVVVPSPATSVVLEATSLHELGAHVLDT